jgi:hypothetical protein
MSSSSYATLDVGEDDLTFDVGEDDLEAVDAVVGVTGEFVVTFGMVGFAVGLEVVAVVGLRVGLCVGLRVGLFVGRSVVALTMDGLGTDVKFPPMGGRVNVALEKEGAAVGAAVGPQSFNVNLACSTVPRPRNGLAGM